MLKNQSMDNLTIHLQVEPSISLHRLHCCSQECTYTSSSSSAFYHLILSHQTSNWQYNHFGTVLILLVSISHAGMFLGCILSLRASLVGPGMSPRYKCGSWNLSVLSSCKVRLMNSGCGIFAQYGPWWGFDCSPPQFIQHRDMLYLLSLKINQMTRACIIKQLHCIHWIQKIVSSDIEANWCLSNYNTIQGPPSPPTGPCQQMPTMLLCDKRPPLTTPNPSPPFKPRLLCHHSVEQAKQAPGFYHSAMWEVTTRATVFAWSFSTA